MCVTTILDFDVDLSFMKRDIVLVSVLNYLFRFGKSTELGSSKNSRNFCPLELDENMDFLWLMALIKMMQRLIFIVSIDKI